MPVCPSGAEPIPGYTTGSLILTLSETALGDVAGMLAGLWGELAVQPVIARMSLDNLCALNPDPPGAPTWQDLEAMTSMLPGGFSLDASKPFPAWLIKQVEYHYFSVSCRCINPAETVPPRPPVSTPPGTQPWPTDHGSQPQITRIEHSQDTHFDGLTTLYNGIMELNTQIGDMSWYVRPQVVGSGWHPVATIAGEGILNVDSYAEASGFQPGDVAGCRVDITTLPTVYKVRGTLVPRYYGIGSVMWLTSDATSGIDVVNQRTSLHYMKQFVPMPPNCFHARLAYRLMPGAQATVGFNTRGVHGAWYGGQGFDPRTLLRMSDNLPPSDWYDPPFYPKPPARLSAPGAAP